MSPRNRLTSTPYGCHAGFSDMAFMAETVGENAVNSTSIADGTIELIDLGQNGALPGQVIKWNGSQWEVADNATGTGSADGVALAAIKALYETQQELSEKIKQLEQLEIRVAKLEKILQSLSDNNSALSEELAHD